MELVGVIEHGADGEIYCASVLQAKVVNTVVAGLPSGHFALTLPVEAVMDEPDRYWVSNGQVTPRSELPATVTIGVGQIMLTGLPIPCTVSALGVSEQSVDGTLLVEFDEPGAYLLTLTSPPQYLEKMIEVTIP